MLKRLFNLFTIMLLLFVFTIGCRQQTQQETDSANAETKGEVEIVYVEWSCATASTNLMKALLEQRGYDVNITPVTAAVMWKSLATGDADAMTTAWLPTTHGHYLEKVKNQVDDLGPNLTGTRIGLVVPEYVTIDSITEMSANADKFDNEIIGIDPGAGIMSKTEKVLEEYNLDNFKLVEGSGATMTAALRDAIKNKEWIAVTGWTPHWKFGRWNLKYLDDPKKVYGGAEYIHTITRKGLKKDMPEVYQILDNFNWKPETLQGLMAANQEEGADPYENAKEWLKNNPDKIAEWTKGLE